eukprot:3411810-Rhodomonas_salina.2
MRSAFSALLSLILTAKQRPSCDANIFTRTPLHFTHKHTPHDTHVLLNRAKSILFCRTPGTNRTAKLPFCHLISPAAPRNCRLGSKRSGCGSMRQPPLPSRTPPTSPSRSAASFYGGSAAVYGGSAAVYRGIAPLYGGSAAIYGGGVSFHVATSNIYAGNTSFPAGSTANYGRSAPAYAVIASIYVISYLCYMILPPFMPEALPFMATQCLHLRPQC